MLPRRLTACVLLFLLLVAAEARADVVHLANGRQIRGRIVEEGDEEILLEIPGGRQTVHRRDIVRIDRESEYVYYLRQGEDLLKNKAFAMAADHFAQALRIQPGSVEASRGMAGARKGQGDRLLDRRRLREAIEAYEAALAADPDHEEAKEKLEYVRKVVAMAKGLQERSAVLSGEGKFAEAARSLQKVLTVDPSQWSTLAPRLGELYRKAGDQFYREGKHEEAARAYDRALRSDPDLLRPAAETRVYCHLRKVDALIEAEDLGAARTLLDELRYDAPAHPRVLYAAGRIEQAEGNLLAARDAYLRVLGEGASPEDPTDLAAMGARAREALGAPPDPGKEVEAPVEEEWKEIALGPIRIHHKQPKVARDVALAAEYYLKALPAHIGPLPRPNPLHFDIWIHPDQDSYREAGGRGRSILIVDARKGDAPERTIRLDASAPQTLTCDFPREVGRLLFLTFHAYRRVHPPWVEEGLVTRCEPVFKRYHYLSKVADVYWRGEKDPIRRLLQGARITGEEDRALAYAVVEYLISRRGLHAFNQAVDDLIRFPVERFLSTRYGIETRFGIDPVDQLSDDLRDWVFASTRPEEGGE